MFDYIAGYAYNTEIYCPDDIVPVVQQLLIEHYMTIDIDNAESMLDRLAAKLGHDRADWDTTVYPVAISQQQAEQDREWALHDGCSVARCYVCHVDITEL